MIHGKRRAGQTKNHQREFTRHKPGGRNGKMLYRGVRKLGKEDILGSFPGSAHNFHGSAHIGLPEGEVEHMVQTKGNQGALGQTVNPCAKVSGVLYQPADIGDTGLNGRPDKKHQDAYQQIDRRGNNRHKPRAAKKGEHLRQTNVKKAVMQGGGSQTHNDTAKNPHLQGVDAQH